MYILQKLSFTVTVIYLWVIGNISSVVNADSFAPLVTQSSNWSQVPSNVLPPTFILNDGSGYGSGYKFQCNFTSVDPLYMRCYWTETFSTVSLSNMATLTMKVKAENASRIQFITLYLKDTDNNWYLSNQFFPKEGWNNVAFQLNEFTKDGGGTPPAGAFNNINGLRLNVFSFTTDSASTCTVSALGAATSTTTVYGDTPALFSPPTPDTYLQRSIRRDSQNKLLESRIVFDENGDYISGDYTPGHITENSIDKIARSGFNVYIPCVWHGRGARYHSLNGTGLDSQFASAFNGSNDPTATMIAYAHSKNLEVHAWFTVSSRGTPDPLPQFSKVGAPPQAYDLQDPAFRNYIVKEITSFAANYNVDGINLDFVRTQGTATSSNAAASYRTVNPGYTIAEIEDVSGNALQSWQMSSAVKSRFQNWQAVAVDDIVQRVSQQISAVKPNILLSVDGSPKPKPTLSDEGRNEWKWIENGWIDVAFNMDYSWSPNYPSLIMAAASIVAPKAYVPLNGNWDTAGTGYVFRNEEQVKRLVDYSLRKFPGNGTALYWTTSLTEAQIMALRAAPFKENALPYWINSTVSSVVQSLRARWTLDETDGTTSADVSGNGCTLTLNGGINRQPGQLGGALAFNGTASGALAYAVSSPSTHLNLTNQLTVAMWVYNQADGDYCIPISHGRWNQDGWYWWIKQSNPWVFSYSSASQSQSIVCPGLYIVPQNQWVHLATVIDNTAKIVTFYVNGVSKGTGTMQYPFSGNLNRLVYLGTYEGLDTRAWKGLLDDVRIYDYALSSTEINSLYSPQALRARWKLDESAGTNAIDFTGHSHTATLSGNTAWSPFGGKIGGGLSFSGTTSYADCGAGTDLNITDHLTVAMWVYNQASNNNSIVVSKGVYMQDGWYWWIGQSGQWIFNYCASSQNQIITCPGGAVVPLNQWVHLATVVDNTASVKTVKFYVNGSPKGLPTSMSYSFTGNQARKLYLGDYDSTHSYPWKGMLDDVRIYNSLLATEDIQNLMTDYPFEAR